MLQIAIVEDELCNREQLHDYVIRYGKEVGENFHIRCFACGDDLLKQYDSRYDLILMDIEMPGADGMQTARRLRQMDDQVVLVFITNMSQYEFH